MARQRLQVWLRLSILKWTADPGLAGWARSPLTGALKSSGLPGAGRGDEEGSSETRGRKELACAAGREEEGGLSQGEQKGLWDLTVTPTNSQKGGEDLSLTTLVCPPQVSQEADSPRWPPGNSPAQLKA